MVFTKNANLEGVIRISTIFLGKVAEQKKLRRLTNGDLAKMTGFQKSTIDALLGGGRWSDRVADAVAMVLKIER